MSVEAIPSKERFQARSASAHTTNASDHMMLAAADQGLGSVWICAFDPTGVRAAFDLPASLVPVNILAVGHAEGEWKSPERHAAERIPISELVTKA